MFLLVTADASAVHSANVAALTGPPLLCRAFAFAFFAAPAVSPPL